MKKIQTSLVGITLIVLSSCGMPDADKEEIAIITCNVMGESRNMDSAMRIKELNAAREKIGEDRFLQTDAVIKESMKYSLCKDLVLNDSYDEKLSNLKAIEAEQKLAEAKIKAEKQRIAAEKQRIADSKPSIKKEYFPNGNLRRIVRYQAKNDGGLREGLAEEFAEDGKLLATYNFLNGKLHGEYKVYYENGQIRNISNNKHGRLDGLWVDFDESGKETSKSCWKDGSSLWNDVDVDLSYCEQ
jgi:hypothetical protein